MIVTREEASRIIGNAWPNVDVGQPTPLTGGFWASMWRVPISGQPPAVADEVVVRFAPSTVMGAKEAAVQQAIATAGFPTPHVWISQPAETGDGWWSVMDFSTGGPLLAGLDGIAALRRAPSLLRTLPVQLATAMDGLHRLDPTPVTAAVEGVDGDVAWSAADLLDHHAFGAEATGRNDVAAAIERLRADQPRRVREVVCHGDLHPFNVLADNGTMVVLDWTGSVVADPCFDLAFTELLLANPPLQLPGPLVAVGRGAGRLLARRFVASYTKANPEVSLAGLDWYRALHSARLLVDVTNMRAEQGPGAGGHPWTAVAPAAARHLSAVTGIEVQG